MYPALVTRCVNYPAISHTSTRRQSQVFAERFQQIFLFLNIKQGFFFHFINKLDAYPSSWRFTTSKTVLVERLSCDILSMRGKNQN